MSGPRPERRFKFNPNRWMRRCAGGLTILAALCGTSRLAHGQGCILSPNNPVSPILPADFTNTVGLANNWLVNVSYRWYRSDRHFQGDVEQTQRQADGTEVINDVHLFDLSATYGFNDRWSATLNVPFMTADRSSLYEHDRVSRHTMHSGGLGDMRLVTDFWLLDPHKHMDGNVALGAGLKFPTGDDKAADIAYRSAAQGGPVYRPVDPSIQPGDGGWGVILEIQAYQKIFDNVYGYASGSYMFTPEEQNDTQTPLGDLRPPGPTTFDSIPDQYFGRVGVSYVFWPEKGLTASLGGRIEGIPAYDAIGGSLGFRRPGYTVSVEPGISWTGAKNSFSLYTPVAVYRNRVRSAPEELLGRPGGDAAFADFSILASYTHRF